MRFPSAASRPYAASLLGSTAVFSVGAMLVFDVFMYMLAWPTHEILDELTTFVVAVGACGVVGVAWCTLRALDRIGPGTGAGMWLATLALSARAIVDVLSVVGGFWYADVSATELEPAPTLAWLVRNTSLVALGLGLGLVVVSSAIDWRRRRTAPAWTRPVD